MDNIIENDSKSGGNNLMGIALEQALKEAVDDETFRKVKRMSYSGNAAEEVSEISNTIFFARKLSFLQL